MKKLIASLFVSIVVLCGFTVAATIPVTDLSGPTSCNSNETVEYKFYLTSNGLSRKPYDVFGNTVDSLVGGGNNGSSINIWKHGVISSCNTWNRISNVVSAGDSNGALIFLNADNCVFNIPNYTKVSNPTAIDAQIHYTIGYRLIYNEGANTMTSRLYHRDYGVDNWTCYPAGNSVSNSDNCSEVTVKYGSQKYHTGECLNYRVFRCGDGLVNSPYGTTYDNGPFTEQCDPNDPTHAGRGNGGCSASCQPINNTQPPVCNTAYNGTHYVNNPIYPNWLNAGMNLCSIGTVSNFTNRWNGYGHVGHYSWTCSNSAGSISCQANQQRCGDGLVNGNEACDPNDQTHSGWNNNGYSCNASCQLVPPPTQNPQCNAAYSGTHYVNDPAYPNWLNAGMNLCSIGTVSNLTHRWSGIGHVGHYGWTCSNSAGSINCQANQQRCGDGLKNGNEACDPNDSTHSGRGNGGCSDSCQPINVQNPQCNSQYNGQTQYTPNSNPWLNNTMNLCTIGTLSNFNYSGTPRLFTWNCSTGGNTVNCSANQQWCGDSQLNGSEQCDYNDPTHAGRGDGGCSKLCQPIINPGSPVPYLLKQQKTGGMANFTTNQINVEIGETITYKVNFGNSGTVAATGEVWDILPPCVNYLTSSIHLPAGVTYNGPTVGPVNAGNQTMVKYSNFRLNPGQGGYMLVQAQVRGTGMNGMTSCQNTYSYLNTGYFKFVGGNTLQSAVVAVRPQAPQLPHLTINKELITAGDMTAGSTVVYKITLTNDGNATYHNAYILDILPNAIQYQTSSIQNITNYLFEEGTTGNNDYFIRYYNFDLAAGRSAIVYLTGILKQGFNFNQTVNCAFTSGDDSCVPFPSDPIPFIKKWQKVGNMSFTDEIIQVELGDTITYKVDFGNIGNRGATGQVWDILPPCVKYVSSSIHLPSDISYSLPHTGQQGVQDFVMYNNFYLAAGQTGYMLIEAKIKESGIPGVNCSDTRSYLNTGYFKFVGGQPLSSDVLAIREESAGSEVIFDKTGNKKLMHPGEGGLEFYITVTNKGPNPISNIYVDDIRPHEDCIIYKGWSGDESLIEYIDPLRRHYIGLQGAKTNYNLPSEPSSSQTHIKGTLYAGQSFNFTIFASVKNDPSCVGHYINKAILTYTEGGETHTVEDDYDFEVIDDNPDFACKSLTSSGSIVIIEDNNQGKMKFRCEASDSNPHNIAIYCGNGRSGSVSNQSSFEYTCRYSSSEEGANYNAYCLVDGQEPTNPACIKKIGINPGLYGDCGNGIIEAGEDCDLKSPRGVSVIITDYLDAAQTIRAGQYEGNYCKNCKMITGDNFVYEPAECLYSDTPISVMENEIIPFWWRLWLKDNQLVGDNGCYADASYSDSYEKGSSSNSNSSLSPRSKGTLLKKSSMNCTFAIYNGSNKLQGTTNSVQTITLPCFNKQENFNTLKIYKYFIKNHQTENFNGGTEILTVNALLNGNQTKKYGEYKLVLEKVDYEYCDKTVGLWEKGKRYGAVCEVDFAVTKPYMMQVSTFGVNPVGSNGVAFLDDYYDMNGKKILDSTDLRETIDTENRNYAVSSDAKKQMDTFASKYKSLAVKVNTSSVKNLFGGNTNGIESVSKVPNQPIYFVKGNGGTLTLSQSKTSNKTAAYTIFVENANVEIVGKFLQYAMIITDGTISFKDNAGDSKDRCTEGGQAVQGIFVALKGFKESTPSLININENQERCARGGLHVKGVLIGSNINNLLKGRRSQLNSWFNVNYVGWSDQRIRTDRKKKIMEGAALLIEYSPELWKSLPPGAEIFTESLEVYRK